MALIIFFYKNESLIFSEPDFNIMGGCCWNEEDFSLKFRSLLLPVDLSVTPKFETDISCRLKDKRFHQTQLSIVAWNFFFYFKNLNAPTLLRVYQTSYFDTRQKSSQLDNYVNNVYNK